MKLEFREEEGVMVPNLSPAQSSPTELGLYARKRLNHLKAEKPALYTELLTSGKLDAHLAEVEESANAMCRVLVSRTARAEGIDEALKRRDPERWAQAMGEIQATADSTVMREVVLT